MNPALIAFFDGDQCGQVVPAVGSHIGIDRPNRPMLMARVTEIKRHGRGVSFFLPGLTRQDVPAGATIRWTAAVSATADHRIDDGVPTSDGADSNPSLHVARRRKA